MGWLDPMPLIAVLLVVAIAAAGGFWASVLWQRRKSRTRGPFVAGVLCGVMVGVALTGRRRVLNALGASTLKGVIGPLPAGIAASAGGVVAGALTGLASLMRRVPEPPSNGFVNYWLTTSSRIMRSIARGAAAARYPLATSARASRER